MTASRGKQNLIVVSVMCLIAGLLLIIGDKHVGIIFFIGIGLFMFAFIAGEFLLCLLYPLVSSGVTCLAIS